MTTSAAWRRHSIFDELESSLASLLPNEAVAFAGTWLPATRRTYTAAGQSGTGAAPFADVIDLRWRGTLTCSVPVAGIVFLATPTEVFWAKSQPAASSLDVDVSLHAYADYSPNLATFTATVGGAGLPGIPVPAVRDPAATCALGSAHLMTNQVEPLVQTGEAAIAILLLLGPFLKVGRRRIWRLRNEIASSLSPRAREMLTRRRSGSIPMAA